MTARVTVEILGPIPVAELTVTTAVVRPGKSVELVEATMTHGDRAVATARAWRVRRTAGIQVETKARQAPPMPDESLDADLGSGLHAVDGVALRSRQPRPTRAGCGLGPDAGPAGRG